MKIAIAQMCSGIDPAQNVDNIITSLHEASKGGAKILFTPEMSNVIDSNGKRALLCLSEEADDAQLVRIQAAAAEVGIWVQLGSMAFLTGKSDGRRVNRALVIDDKGKIRARYDKMHLFDVDLPTGESWRESASYVSGDHAVVAATPLGLLGLSICYDLRFPSLYQAHSAAGATVLAIPSAFTASTGKAHWHVLMRGRAIENAAWVIAAAQSGVHQDGRTTFGHSLVINPWGEIILDMGEACGIGFAEIDQAITDDVRARIPVIAHRRVIPAAEIAS